MSTINETNGSLPDIPEDISRGSSVSTNFVNEYEEILKYAIVAPKVHVQQDVYTKDAISLCSQTSDNGTESASCSDSVAENVILNIKNKTMGNKNSAKIIRFANQTNNAMDTLLEFEGQTPVRNNEFIESNNSTPESINIPSPSSSIDKDLIRMDGLLDDWLLQLKRNVLSEMADMKMRQFQIEESTIRDLKAKQTAEVLRLNHDVEGLKELLYTFESNVKQKDEVIQNLTDILKKQKEKSDKIRLFSMWRLKHSDEQRQDFSSKMAEKYYNKTLCNKVWIAWRSVVENKWKQRVEKACQIKSQEVCLQLTQDYEERLQALQRELNTARGEVAHMHTERDHYEENMKKAFMRGVCALNMEAMTMFKEGKPNEDTDDAIRPHPSCLPPNQYNDAHTAHSTSYVAPPNESSHTNSNSMQSNGKENIRNIGNKHVTFGSTSTDKTSRPSSSSSNRATRKNVNVKMTGKREFSRKEKHAGVGSKQSSISSIKVERHLPLDALSNTMNIPLKRDFSKLHTQNSVKIVD